MWIKIAGILLRNRVAFIVGVLLITVFMGFQIPKVEMSYEYSNLLPATDSAYLDYLDFHEKFGQEGNVMVFAIQDKDFYVVHASDVRPHKIPPSLYKHQYSIFFSFFQ